MPTLFSNDTLLPPPTHTLLVHVEQTFFLKISFGTWYFADCISRLFFAYCTLQISFSILHLQILFCRLQFANGIQLIVLCRLYLKNCILQNLFLQNIWRVQFKTKTSHSFTKSFMWVVKGRECQIMKEGGVWFQRCPKLYEIINQLCSGNRIKTGIH